MKIAYFAFDQFVPSKHAGFVHTYSIVKALKERGNNITLYAIPAHPKLYNPFRWSDNYSGIDIHYVRFTVSYRPEILAFAPLNILSYYKTLEALKKQNPDIIHDRFHLPNPFSIKIFEKLGIPKILEVNSLYIEDEAYKGIKAKKAERDRRTQFEQASAIITQTETLAIMIRGLTNKPVFIIPNGVDTEQFRPDIGVRGLRRELGVSEEDVVITFVGSFKKWHGVHHIPDIARKLKTERRVKFLLIGSGELFDDVKRSKTDDMILLGAKSHDEIPKYLALSDILIAPFDDEYFKKLGFWWNPVKLFEYISSGKPIVSYDYGEIRKIVRGAGLLAEPGNINDFVEKLGYLVECEDERRRMGEIGRSIALKEYDWVNRAEEVMETYRRVLSSDL